MKLIFPPKKFQIMFVLSAPVLWLVSIAFSTAGLMTNIAEFPMLFVYDHNNLFAPIVSLLRFLPEDVGKILFFILVPIVCYGLVTWVIGSAVWVLVNVIKNKKGAVHDNLQDKT